MILLKWSIRPNAKHVVSGSLVNRDAMCFLYWSASGNISMNRPLRGSNGLFVMLAGISSSLAGTSWKGKRGEDMLTEQNKLFVEEYLKLRCKNATQAAIAAGYSAKTASSQASMLLKHPEVAAYLKERKDEMSQALRGQFVFDALEAREAMYKILKDPDSRPVDVITVAKDFLDRAGFKPSDEVKVSGDINNPFAGMTTEELRAMINSG